MTSIEVAGVILTLAACLGYLNAKFLRFPSSIGLMAMSLLGSFAILGLEWGGLVSSEHLHALVLRADFANVLMHGLLGLLLFAGALHVDLADLADQRWPIAALALGGTLLSTALVGGATYFLMRALGRDIGLPGALLFGALISPTDPIAVLGILKSARAPRDLAVQISGESLFNDGVGVVLFLVISAASSGGDVTASGVALLFLREAVGGALFGLALGYLGFRLLRSIDDYSIEVLITVAMVIGGYAAAERVHVSAPIAAVVCGLVVGNHGRRLAMSDVTREHVDMFWKLIDEILNAVLFLMLGLEAARLRPNAIILIAAAIIIPIVLLARLTSVAAPVALLRTRLRFAPHSVQILTWGGLRGGISVALAMSVPEGPSRSSIFFLTYAVVVFSVLVQGLSLGSLLRRFESKSAAASTPSA